MTENLLNLERKLIKDDNYFIYRCDITIVASIKVKSRRKIFNIDDAILSKENKNLYKIFQDNNEINLDDNNVDK